MKNTMKNTMTTATTTTGTMTTTDEQTMPLANLKLYCRNWVRCAALVYAPPPRPTQNKTPTPPPHTKKAGSCRMKVIYSDGCTVLESCA